MEAKVVNRKACAVKLYLCTSTCTLLLHHKSKWGIYCYFYNL